MQTGTYKTAPHTPAHLFQEDALYMITASTYQKQPYINSNERKTQWRDAFFKACELYHWHIIAWVVLINHYHVILRSPEQNATNLPKLIASLHKFTARRWNIEDNKSGRKIWWNYWDTCLRTERDFETRLRYIFWNPVKHGLVSRPENYQFSNYQDFLRMEIDLAPFDPSIEVKDVSEY